MSRGDQDRRLIVQGPDRGCSRVARPKRITRRAPLSPTPRRSGPAPALRARHTLHHLAAGDQSREETPLETRVDVHHRHVRRATVEHRQHRRQAAEVRPVTDARRHTDHRTPDVTRHDTRQRRLHPGHDNDRVRPLEPMPLRRQAVRPGHPHVVHEVDLAAHPPRGFGRFLGHGTVPRSSRQHAHPTRGGTFDNADPHGPGGFVVNRLGKRSLHRRRLLRRDARRQARLAVTPKYAEDLDHLGGGFPRP